MKVKLNSSLSGLSGTMDDWVYRTVNGRVVAYGRPESAPREPTAAQIAARKRFAQAIDYAAEVLADPIQRELYDEIARQRNRRTDKVVASDYLTPPEVKRIDLSGYGGAPGGLIRVIAIDDIEVVAVHVALRLASGTILEQGAATKIHGAWRYNTTKPKPAGEPLTILVTATDRPGNQATGEALYR